MKTPTQAMFWQIWKGWRWSFVGWWAYLLAAAVVARLLPGLLRGSPVTEAFLPNAGVQLALPCAFLLIHLAAVFSLTGAELKERGYWKTMFVLPVRTRTLVAWPMIWGSLTIGFVWLFVACLILRPMGHAAPLVWPIFALVVGLTLLQALSWMPLAQQWLGIVIALPLILLVATGAVLVAVFQVPEPIATGIFAGLLPLTYVACMRGVAAARRGDAFDWRLWNRLVDWANAIRKPAEHPFRSAARAHLWFECRCFAGSLPLFIALFVPGIVVMLVLEQGSDAAITWRLLAGMVLMPAVLATFLGTAYGSVSFPFIATRPVSTAALVRSKFAMALVTALVAYIPVLLALPIFLIWPSFFAAALQAARGAGTPKTAMVLLLAIALPPLLTWKGLAEQMWMGLTGRIWLINAFAFGFAGLLGGGTLFSVWTTFYPNIQAWLVSLVPWFIGLLVALKLVVATWVLYTLIHLRFIRPAAAAQMIGLWSAVAAVSCLLAIGLMPDQLVPIRGILAAVVLFVPFSRLAGAPLALEWNRHR